MTLNIEAIDKTIEAIRSSKDRFEMSVFISDPAHICKTVACIAGWAVLANAPEKAVAAAVNRGAPWDTIAAEILGLENDEQVLPGGISSSANKLFLMYTGPYGEDLHDELKHLILEQLGDKAMPSYSILRNFDMLPSKVRKSAAIHVLTRLKETGKIDWLYALNAAFNKNNQSTEQTNAS